MVDITSGARMETDFLDEYRRVLSDEENLYGLLGLPKTLQADVPLTEDSDLDFKFFRSVGDTREAIARLNLSKDSGSIILKAPQTHPAPQLDEASVSVKEEDRIVLFDDRKESKLRVLRTVPVDSRRSLVTTFAYDSQGAITSAVHVYLTDPSTGGNLTEPLITVPGDLMVRDVRNHQIGDFTVAPMPHPARRILGDPSKRSGLALGVRLVEADEEPFRRFRLEFHSPRDFSSPSFPQIVELMPTLPLEGLQPKHLLEMVGRVIRSLIPPPPRPKGE